MEIAEIKDLLNKMNAFAEDGDSLDSTALMQDPIVLNRLAVELLQQIDRDAKPELVIAPEGIESYFGYSVALAAWMRFVSAQVGKDGVFELPAGVEVKKNEKTILVLDTYSEEKANALMSLALAEGAKVTIEEVNYDDCVRMAAAEAAQTEHGVIVQDTAWDGYEEIPSWIMQGYGTMANEAADQLRQCSVNRPTHVFVQAGVGSLAGAVVGYFANLFPNDPPKFVVMEAEAADCLYQGALANDGKPRIVTGDLKTIMAGLACGEPNTISWDILRNHVSAFISCPDWVSAKGMRMLSSPVKGDPRVVSGESGAVGMGVLDAIMCDDTYKELRDALELDRHSRVLMFSTEGNTDPEKYRRVVWDGEYPTDDTPQEPC